MSAKIIITPDLDMKSDCNAIAAWILAALPLAEVAVELDPVGVDAKLYDVLVSAGVRVVRSCPHCKRFE